MYVGDFSIFLPELLTRIAILVTSGDLDWDLDWEEVLRNMTNLFKPKVNVNWSNVKVNGSSEQGPEDCETLVDPGIFVHGSLGFAILLAFVYAFMERRTKRSLECCFGRPAVVVPINLLDDFKHRWAYACAFGAITNTIVVIFMDSGTYITFPDQVWSSVVAGLLVAMEVCVNFSPFFFCINTSHKVAGNLIGLLYAGMWLGVHTIVLISCANPVPQLLPYIGLVVQIPCLLCLGVLIIRFLVMLILAIKDCCKPKEQEKMPIALDWQVNYVKDLMMDNPIRHEKDYNSGLSCWGKTKFWWSKFIWARRPNFQYSTRMVCTIFVVFCCTYQIAVVYFWINTWLLNLSRDAMKDFLDMSGLPLNSTTVDNINLALKTTDIAWNVVTGVSAVLFALNILLVVGRYRWHMLKLYKGDHTFLPDAFLNTARSDNAYIVRSCMLFSGYQIAYMIWGFFIVNFVLWICSLLVVFLLIMPLANGIFTVVLWLAEVMIIPTVLNFVLRLIQKIMAKRLFLQDKLEDTDKDKPLAIDNLRFFHVTNYFFFMANIQTGLFSCLFRIIKGLIFGLIYLGRMDRCVLMSGFEGGDPGYMAYLGMLYVEKTHNNPVMRVFCQILKDSQTQNYPKVRHHAKKCHYGGIDEQEEVKSGLAQKGEQDVEAGEVACEKEVTAASEMTEATRLTEPAIPEVVLDTKPPVTSHSRAVRRWKLMYTLIHNPTLVANRKHVCIQEEDVKKEEGILSKAERQAGTVICMTKYEEYLKLREKLDKLEVQVFGSKVKRRKRKSVGCQAVYEEMISVQQYSPLVGTEEEQEVLMQEEEVHGITGRTNMAVDKALDTSMESNACTDRDHSNQECQDVVEEKDLYDDPEETEEMLKTSDRDSKSKL